ncbi:hypothetical protein IK146_01430 [Candidatus Saccharibacteria bacterium]|nr:hypothetical protein [Candidatus Saccharibacteria bacterium]
MPHLINKFKKGATSIYVVVIGTLLFSVITVSFIRIIINETAKTTNDELAQSAYDSALAGVEDAKTALKRYYECKAVADSGALPTDCENIEKFIELGFQRANMAPDQDGYGYCDAVSEALSRRDGSGEVLVQEQTSNNDSGNIVQAYTCVIIDDSLGDYRSTVNSSTPIRVIPLKTENPASVTGIRISWYTEEDGLFSTMNYANADSFYSTNSSLGTPTPPTVTAQIIQTAGQFTLDQFNSYDSSTKATNRGTIVLVPEGDDATANVGTSHPAGSSAITHIGHYSDGTTILADSNNHNYNRDTDNQPQKIKCRTTLSDEFACVASIEVPGPINGTDGSGNVTERNANTFFLVLTLPYGNPTTTFSVQMCTDRDTPRGDCLENGKLSVAEFKGVQIAVDSTGRANDMYSRVEARLEFKDNFPFAEFALQATGNGDDSIKKNFYVTSNCINTDDPYNIRSCKDTDELDS